MPARPLPGQRTPSSRGELCRLRDLLGLRQACPDHVEVQWLGWAGDSRRAARITTAKTRIVAARTLASVALMDEQQIPEVAVGRLRAAVRQAGPVGRAVHPFVLGGTARFLRKAREHRLIGLDGTAEANLRCNSRTHDFLQRRLTRKRRRTGGAGFMRKLIPRAGSSNFGQLSQQGFDACAQ